MDKLDKFTLAYIEAALWASTDDDGMPMDDRFTVADIHPATMIGLAGDCAAFQADHANLLSDIDSEAAGHDFWLTRCRAGVGFWDRGLGEIGERLTAAAHQYPSIDLYVGDDGKVHS